MMMTGDTAVDMVDMVDSWLSNTPHDDVGIVELSRDADFESWTTSTGVEDDDDVPVNIFQQISAASDFEQPETLDVDAVPSPLVRPSNLAGADPHNCWLTSCAMDAVDRRLEVPFDEADQVCRGYPTQVWPLPQLDCRLPSTLDFEGFLVNDEETLRRSMGLDDFDIFGGIGRSGDAMLLDDEDMDDAALDSVLSSSRHDASSMSSTCWSRRSCRSSVDDRDDGISSLSGTSSSFDDASPSPLVSDFGDSTVSSPGVAVSSEPVGGRKKSGGRAATSKLQRNSSSHKVRKRLERHASLDLSGVAAGRRKHSASTAAADCSSRSLPSSASATSSERSHMLRSILESFGKSKAKLSTSVTPSASTSSSTVNHVIPSGSVCSHVRPPLISRLTPTSAASTCSTQTSRNAKKKKRSSTVSNSAAIAAAAAATKNFVAFPNRPATFPVGTPAATGLLVVVANDGEGRPFLGLVPASSVINRLPAAAIPGGLGPEAPPAAGAAGPAADLSALLRSVWTGQPAATLSELLRTYNTVPPPTRPAAVVPDQRCSHAGQPRQNVEPVPATSQVDESSGSLSASCRSQVQSAQSPSLDCKAKPESVTASSPASAAASCRGGGEDGDEGGSPSAAGSILELFLRSTGPLEANKGSDAIVSERRQQQQQQQQQQQRENLPTEAPHHQHGGGSEDECVAAAAAAAGSIDACPSSSASHSSSASGGILHRLLTERLDQTANVVAPSDGASRNEPESRELIESTKTRTELTPAAGAQTPQSTAAAADDDDRVPTAQLPAALPPAADAAAVQHPAPLTDVDRTIQDGTVLPQSHPVAAPADCSSTCCLLTEEEASDLMEMMCSRMHEPDADCSDSSSCSENTANSPQEVSMCGVSSGNNDHWITDCFDDLFLL